MFVNSLFIASNPFFDAYYHSDILGKAIMVALMVLSVVTWTLILQKGLQIMRVRVEKEVDEVELLANINSSLRCGKEEKNPYDLIYSQINLQTNELLKKNQDLIDKSEQNYSVYLSSADMELIYNGAYNSIAQQIKKMEQHLYILSTIVTLAPFVGLLGTVWGILTTFSQMQLGASGSGSQMILAGLSLALATTVLGLIDAIPALIGYNWLKNSIKSLEIEMEGFCNELIAKIEMQYRR